MFFKRLFSVISLSLLGLTVWADDYANLRASVARLDANLQVMSVSETPMSSIYKVVISTGETLYMSTDGQHFLVGNMYQNLQGGELVNLTEVDKQQDRALGMQSEAAQQAWVFKAVGETKASISVFTDVDCFYCQKLHQEMDALNALGIEVRYLAFPRAGLGSSSHQVLADAWCAEDPNAFLTKAKQRAHDRLSALPSPAACDNPVADHYALSQQMGLTGTPAIILASGELWPGYLPADELARRLGIN
ncbi:MAG: thioredoxin fold domain-containing protein [Gammaproteobacteria bacterium]|jgi:thiol:disulfide interchange protein DsbC|nr:thioredoxin fold domain-containing protein [Gammaproteobacteria bacterium]